MSHSRVHTTSDSPVIEMSILYCFQDTVS